MKKDKAKVRFSVADLLKVTYSYEYISQNSSSKESQLSYKSSDFGGGALLDQRAIIGQESQKVKSSNPS